MSETRILIRLLWMYFPQNWEFGSALSKLWNFEGGGGYEPPQTPLSVRHWVWIEKYLLLLITSICIYLLTEVTSLHIMKIAYLKWLPLTTSTDSRPVVPLYARPSSSSGTPPCCMECVEPVLSLRARLSRSEADEFSCSMADTQHLCYSQIQIIKWSCDSLGVTECMDLYWATACIKLLAILLFSPSLDLSTVIPMTILVQIV
jgi:hypothetical protein